MSPSAIGHRGAGRRGAPASRWALTQMTLDVSNFPCVTRSSGALCVETGKDTWGVQRCRLFPRKVSRDVWSPYGGRFQLERNRSYFRPARRNRLASRVVMRGNRRRIGSRKGGFSRVFASLKVRRKRHALRRLPPRFLFGPCKGLLPTQFVPILYPPRVGAALACNEGRQLRGPFPWPACPNLIILRAKLQCHHY